ncbi:UPF0764 protein C16orf89 homolog isoform X2 [Dermacentor albipictus]|uniref:UPF0764 protein C16orf89 homolog isoform X2 n=1 Tax=Dermacentor albipictus TaxID=60249 RepID=UPI0031FC8212
MSVPGKLLALGTTVLLLLGNEQHFRHHAVEARSAEDTLPLDMRILVALEGLVDALGSRLQMTYVDAACGLFFAGVSRGILRHNFWTDTPIPAGVEPAENASGTAPYRAITEVASDTCITQLFSSAQCRDVTSTCWETMTGGRHSGYGLTHQVLFFSIAFKMNCTSVMEEFSELYGQPPPARNLASKCAQVADEAQLVAEIGFPERKRDLFLEQVAVCGFLDRDVFKSTSFIEAALSWQREDGCFATWQHKSSRKHRRRVKREERIDGGGCSMHMTSVGAAALATWLGTLARVELQGQRLLS